MKVLFGGSFNPVHVAHLIIARDVLEDFGFSEVIFVPANVQPLKGELFIPPEVRLKALKSAVEKCREFSVWDYEIKKGGVSYTYQTLRTFREQFKQEPIFMMGADSFLTFHLWRKPEEILKLSRILVVSRPGYDFDPNDVLRKLDIRVDVKVFERGRAEKTGWRIAIYRGRLLEISSTEIRERLKSNKPISHLVPEAVEEVIGKWLTGKCSTK